LRQGGAKIAITTLTQNQMDRESWEWFQSGKGEGGGLAGEDAEEDRGKRAGARITPGQAGAQRAAPLRGDPFCTWRHFQMADAGAGVDGMWWG